MAGSPLVVGVDARELTGRPTGTGRYLRSLLRHWREGGDRFVLYFDREPPPDPVLDHPSLRRRVVPAGGSGLAWQQRALPAAAAGDGLDVFFSPAYTCPWRLPVPRVTAVHDLSYFAWPQDFSFLDGLRRRLTVRWSLAASAAVVVCSDFTRRELARLFPAVAPRARLAPLGPDEDLAPAPARTPARARLGLTGPLVLSTGTVLNRRCAPELLRAVARLRTAHPSLVLDLAGENRTEPRIDLDGLVQRLGLGSRVRLSGFVDEAGLADRYAAADVAVSLSEYEGFGLPALEASARGVPLVAARAPSLGEIFGATALLVDPRDEGAIAAALHRVLTDAPLAARLRDAGHGLAARHSWARTAALTREALAEAAA
ncbi:MAG: glycosyltransferase family 1 protein [Vicinamibacteria bacterium]